MKSKICFLTVVCFLLTIVSHAQNWLLAGNTPTAGQFLGSTNNTDLRFRTNNTQKMVILAGGNVGIGLTTPAEKLDVNGTVLSSKIIYGYPTSGAGGVNGMRFSFNPSTTNLFGFGMGYDGVSKYDMWYATGNANGGGHHFYTGITERMRLKGDGELLLGTTTDNGNYLIQTSLPSSYNGLFVDGSVNAGTALKVKAKDQTWVWHAENGTAQVGLQNQSSGTQWTLDAVNTTLNIQGRSANVKLSTDALADIYITPGRKLKVNLGSDATGDIYYRNSTGDFTRLAAGTNGQVLTLTSGLPSWANSSGGSSQWTTAASNIYYNTGKVGIGTTNLNDANYKLFVEGAIRSRKIRVDQLAWPDYVFHYHYKLRSLKEVEEFIKLNNHLPDVPSAKEIEKEGLDLGDNQAVLLKKIEELTLYLIDQDKKMQELQKQNAELKEIKTQLELLKKMIKEKK